jgi:uncharacterized repeat protein (TIGR02543 family)
MKHNLFCKLIIISLLFFGVPFIFSEKVMAFSGNGLGTTGNPYEITNCEQLQEIGDSLTSHYVLMNNIDCTTATSEGGSLWNGGLGFNPIGDNWNNSFEGKLDGQGNIISGLYINRPDTDFVGLFGYISGAMVEKIGLENVNITGKEYVGGLSGFSSWENPVRASFSQVYVTGNVSGRQRVGGIFGTLSSADIENSYADVDVVSTHAFIGGFVGASSVNTSGTKTLNDYGIVKSYAKGNVQNSNSYPLIGGFSGGDGVFISDSFAVGNVTLTHSSPILSNSGGFQGRSNDSSTVSGIYYHNHSNNPDSCIGNIESGTFPCTAQSDVNYFKNSINEPLASWDFDNVWGIDPSGIINDGFPYLLWQFDHYNVNFNSGGGNAINSQQIIEGGLISEPPDPTRGGYTFDGWFADEALLTIWDFNNDTVNENKTLYAKWNINEYTVSFNLQGGEGVFDSVTQDFDTEIILAADEPLKENYYFVQWNTDSNGLGTGYNAGESFNMPVDGLTLYAIFSLVPLITESPSVNDVNHISAVVNWESNKEINSQVFYGLTNNLEFQTEKTLGITTSHNVTLLSLVSCTRYYYQVQSEDEHETAATSTIASFQTTGCETGTEIENGTEETIDETLGGELELINNSSLAKLTIPNNYANKQATFQINRLGVGGVTAPTDTELIDENIFKLVAVATSDGEQITVFDNDLIFVVTYDSSITDAFDEDTLDVYRYNDGTGLWEPLGCDLNKSNRTLTCVISNFSVFGVFGAFKSVSSVVSSRPTGSSAQNQVSNLIAIGNYEYALQIMKEYPHLFSEAEIEAISKEKIEKDSPAEEKKSLILSVFSFNRNLKIGFTGEDVKELQRFLNENGFTVSSSGPGFSGNETTYFGELTKNALARFQEANNIYPPQGYFGPITRKFISSVEGEITVQTPREAGSGIFNRNLTVGSTGGDVKELQRFLNENGFTISSSGSGSSGSETIYFGELTRSALSRFQETNNISPSIGYFGPITRDFVNR